MRLIVRRRLKVDFTYVERSHQYQKSKHFKFYDIFISLTPGSKPKTSKKGSLGGLGFGSRRNLTKSRKKKGSKGKILENDIEIKKTVPDDAHEYGRLGAQVRDNHARTKVCLDDFTLVETVGKGSFGRVILVTKKDTGKIYAIKVLKKAQIIKRKQFEHTMAERRILEDIDHPFIVSLRYAFQTSQKLFMVFDFFNGGELFHYLSKYGRFGEKRAKLYSAEILLALEHVHSLNIIYRDLKPENILLDSDGHVRITDFGLSKENVTDDSVKSFCGTPEYLAPEVLKRKKYGKAVDWWSLGTLLFEMIAGLPPFYDNNREKMYKKVLNAELKFPAYMSAGARSVCRGILQRDPLKRLGYNGAAEIKSHPFYGDLKWQDVYDKKITPDFVPKTSGLEDTRNIDKVFTEIPACVTPTPADSKLIDKEFTDFTFTANDGTLGAGGDFTSNDLSFQPESIGLGFKTDGFQQVLEAQNIDMSSSIEQLNQKLESSKLDETKTSLNISTTNKTEIKPMEVLKTEHNTFNNNVIPINTTTHTPNLPSSLPENKS